MTTPPLTGTRYGPYAYPLSDLADTAVRGHQEIAATVAAWATRHHDAVALERAGRHDRVALEAPPPTDGA